MRDTGFPSEPSGRHARRLTKRQAGVLQFIREYVAAHEYAPSYQEIAEGLGRSSKATVFAHIQALKAKGLLRTEPSGARALELSKSVSLLVKAVQLPLAGRIAAGAPIEAVQERENIAIPVELLPNLNCYCLQVKGDSMVDDGILDGDYVVVERSFYPRNGDVVVALLDNEYATLKRYYREKDRIRLQPANRTMKPLYVKNPAIQGIVRAVLRRY
ncbi:MAG: SOS regulatory protein LexA [Parcubacteria group bacterium Gr01-1014_38]|nr:MAG: SOS regulatory protein LexA [Parcubacteria group bacterium Gr01-1014_38]